MVPAPALYRHGSARSYARLRGPPWLKRDWVEACVTSASGSGEYTPREYANVFGAPPSPRLVELIERRIAMSRSGPDPLDDLLGAASANVLAWMRREAALADGTEVRIPVCGTDDMCAVVEHRERDQGDWRIDVGSKRISAWPQVRVGLLRDLCGSGLLEAGERSGLTINGASQAHRRHRRRMVEDEMYAARVAEMAQAGVERCHAGKSPGHR